jgi:hypothetical protein
MEQQCCSCASRQVWLLCVSVALTVIMLHLPQDADEDDDLQRAIALSFLEHQQQQQQQRSALEASGGDAELASSGDIDDVMNGLPDMTGGGHDHPSPPPLLSLQDQLCRPTSKPPGKRQHGTEEPPKQLETAAQSLQAPASTMEGEQHGGDAGGTRGNMVRDFNREEDNEQGGVSGSRAKRQRRQEQQHGTLHPATDAAMAAECDQDLLGGEQRHPAEAAEKLQHLAHCAAAVKEAALDDAAADIDLPNSPGATGLQQQYQQQDTGSSPLLSPGEAAAQAAIRRARAGEQKRGHGHLLSGNVGAGAVKGSSNNSSSSWLEDVSVVGMSEDEQLKMAIQESLKSAGAAVAGMGLGPATAAAASAEDADYNYEAALRAALAASAAEQEQDGQFTDATAQASAVQAADAPFATSAEAAAASAHDGVDGNDLGDNVCVVTDDVAEGWAAQQQQPPLRRRRQRPRGPVVRVTSRQGSPTQLA